MKEKAQAYSGRLVMEILLTITMASMIPTSMTMEMTSTIAMALNKLFRLRGKTNPVIPIDVYVHLDYTENLSVKREQNGWLEECDGERIIINLISGICFLISSNLLITKMARKKKKKNC